MKIHEYQAKKILSLSGVSVPKGEVVSKPEEIREVLSKLKFPVVIKAQIHAGGRGKGGGIKLANNPEEAYNFAKNMLGMKLVTYQTGEEGKIVNHVLVEQGMKIKKELYLSIIVDRATSKPVMMVSTEGGVEIEKVAKETPEKIIIEQIDPAIGLAPFQARKLFYALGLPNGALSKAVKFMTSIYKVFCDYDCSLVEINPLVLTEEDDLIALDAKINFDDNALYRHPEIQELRDLSEEEPTEIEAGKYDLNYIKLNGSVGCMVNGAGLAMATMDLIKLAGGEPANFLDVGGGASSERVAKAFEILMSDSKVKAVLINIFGGIVRCDRVAQGVIDALSRVKVNVPVVVRLQGTNAKEAQELLKSSPLNFIVAEGLADAARKAVEAANVKN